MISIKQPEKFNPKFDAVGAFIQHGDEILLLHRHDHKPQGNTWCVPGGKASESESPEEALLREVFEEIGVAFEIKDVNYFEKFFVRYNEYDFAYHVFSIKLEDKPEIKLEEKAHKNYIWITPAKALDLELIEDEDYCIKQLYKV